MIRFSQSSKKQIGFLSMALGCLLVGCRDASTRTQSPQSCIVNIKGQSLFVGEPACLRKLPPKRMSGLWILGHENSVFYEGATTVPRQSRNEVWLEAEPYEALRPYGVEFDGETRVYKIDFIGTKSDAPGVYGHFGMFRRGALLLRIINLKDVTEQTGVSGQ